MERLKHYFGLRYMQPFYAQIIPTTSAMEEFKARGFQHSFAWAKNKAVDDVEKVLSQYREERHDNAVKLPVCVMAMRRNFMQSGKDIGKGVYDSSVVQPDMESENLHDMRTIMEDWTLQIIFIAATDSDSTGLISQFCIYAASPVSRRFYMDFEIGGNPYPFPCVLESNDLMPEVVDSMQSNISIYKVDMLLHATIPYVTDHQRRGYDITVHGDVV